VKEGEEEGEHQMIVIGSIKPFLIELRLLIDIDLVKRLPVLHIRNDFHARLKDIARGLDHTTQTVDYSMSPNFLFILFTVPSIASRRFRIFSKARSYCRNNKLIKN